MPPYLHDIKRLKQNLQLIENFKFGLNHVAGHKSSKLVLTKDIICILASFQSIGNSRKTTKVLGVNKRNIKKGVERCMLLETLENVFWTDFKQTKRSNVLSVHSIELVINWWKSKTIVSPNHKDIIKLQVSTTEFEMHPVHYLQVSQVLS
jgi:hypothetical protein